MFFKHNELFFEVI